MARLGSMERLPSDVWRCDSEPNPRPGGQGPYVTTCARPFRSRRAGKTEEKFGGVPCEGCGFFGCRLSKNIARREILCSGEALEQGSCAEMVCPQEISGTRPGKLSFRAAPDRTAFGQSGKPGATAPSSAAVGSSRATDT